MDISQQILSDICIWSKYAKFIPELSRREDWDEIIDRNVSMHIKKYPLLSKRIQEVYNQYVRPKKVLPSMRSLQFAGAPIEISNVRIFNCFSRDTAFITNRGTKTFEDFSDGDIVTVLTPSGAWRTATVHSYGEQPLHEITFARGRTKTTVRATRNHRWLLKDGSVTTNLQIGDVLTGVTDISGNLTNYGVVRDEAKMFSMHTSNNSMKWSTVDITESPVATETVWCLEVEDEQAFVLSHGIPTGNCAYLPVDHPFAFAETMFLLLSGTGVGYSVQKHHVEKLPAVVGPTEKHRRFLIGDSIEGWAESIKVLIKAYTQGKSNPDFDYRDIRPKGAKLVTAGGKAPGPDPLRICLEQLRAILNNAIGRKLTTLEVHDMLCHIADAVLSGGIRRAAMISLFDRDDMDMLSCKSGTWWEMNPQRGRANNSAVLPRGEVSKEQFMDIWGRVKDSGSGEPGFFWTSDVDLGTNPCISGDALVTVCDHGVSGESTGLPYKIPMKMLVDVVNTSSLPPFALSFNASTGEKEWKPITAAAMTKQDAEIIQLEYEGRTLKCTPDHKILTKGRGWVEAQHLVETDELILD